MKTDVIPGVWNKYFLFFQLIARRVNLIIQNFVKPFGHNKLLTLGTVIKIIKEKIYIQYYVYYVIYTVHCKMVRCLDKVAP